MRSDGTGYRFVKALGHTVTETSPALVPLLIKDGHFFKELSGLSVDAELIVSDSKRKSSFAINDHHAGLSGPSPMNISRNFIAHGTQLSINLANKALKPATSNYLER